MKVKLKWGLVIIPLVLLLSVVVIYWPLGNSNADVNEAETIRLDPEIVQAIKDLGDALKSDPKLLEELKALSANVGTLFVSVNDLTDKVSDFKPVKIVQSPKPIPVVNKRPVKKKVVYRKSAKKCVAVKKSEPHTARDFLIQHLREQKKQVSAQKPQKPKVISVQAPVVQNDVPSDKIKVIVPSNAKEVWGDASGWDKSERVIVKNGVAYIPARQGGRLLINGSVGTNSYLDKYEIVLVAPSGQRLKLNYQNAGTSGTFGNPNLKYAYIGGKLSIP